MELSDHTFKTEYRSGYDNLIRDLYHPALKLANRYWRAVGYFSSSALEAIGQPLGDFVYHEGTIRLITSVELQEKDLEAIERGLKQQQACEQRLLEQIRIEFATQTSGVSLLTSLLEVGRLDIRIAMPSVGRGIYHEKVGIFIDSSDNYVAFSGSSNESWSGLEANYECVDVYCSWKEPERAATKKSHFEMLWGNVAPGVLSFPFPEAAKRELIKVCKPRKDDSPSPKSPSISWAHQDEAIESFLRARRGVLEMATGTGKTRTALRICQTLLDRGEIDTIIIAADGIDLLDQWYSQLLELTKRLPQRFAILRHYYRHHERDYFLLNKQQTILLASRPALAPALSDISLKQAVRTLLIHDEVHRLGSPANRKSLQGLSDNIRYRLGLSATPEREYDQEGNVFIESHIGPVLINFGLDDAIKRGILAPFTYYPIEYIPDDNDRLRLQQVYKRVAALDQKGTPMSEKDVWIELARVYKTSRAKLPLFEEFIREHQELLKRCIIFVETRDYGDEVLPIVHKYRHDFHTYYAEEDSSTLTRFAQGEIECLLTCHRLSEGIDIRSLETVILFSSARARLETIQRMGRCLRVNPEDPQKRANVVDFIRVSDANGDPDMTNTDLERWEWLTRLSEIAPEQQTI